MDYFIRYRIGRNGKITEVKVPKHEVMKEINRMIREDKKMLKILEQL
ncbi:MAG: hypothetical protein HYY37_03520 [Candidatus Aenigmarchaeota archaeon]|nr:hypothetical protein [Candidatus Aenigmarchaeota archaeon]